MIRVGKVQIQKQSTSVQLYCDFNVDGSPDRLWFEVEDRYSGYLAPENGDAFFVILVLFAHLRGEDIEFETPVSARIYYGVVEYLLPGLRIALPESANIRVFAKTKDFQFSPSAHGTALSLGVDSFHALVSNISGPFPVSHVALFNSGAFGELGGEKARKRFKGTAESVARVADKLELPFILVDSNMSEILQAPFVLTHSIRNISCTLLFPHLFKMFSYASGYPVEHFQLRSVSDATRYDLLMSKALVTESLEVMISGLHERRIDKISDIALYSPALQYLNVCLLIESNPFLAPVSGNVRNCSRCYKCVKTLAAIDALGMLDAFSRVFDIDCYSKRRSANLGWMVYASKRLKDVHASEILQQGKGRAGFIPPTAYWFAFMRGAHGVMRKLPMFRAHS